MVPCHGVVKILIIIVIQGLSYLCKKVSKVLRGTPMHSLSLTQSKHHKMPVSQSFLTVVL